MKKSKKLETFVLKNKIGAYAKVTNYGGIIMELLVPTKDGVLRDVVLGFDNPEDYLNPHPYFGAIIGRYANRIAEGKFELEGQTYELTQNIGNLTLHGGEKGFDKRLWDVASVSKSHIVLHTRSGDGDEGFPGELDVRVKYMFDNDNQLLINYRATTNKTTVLNLTNHSYFNLDGAGNGDILNHTLQIDSNFINPIDYNNIPLPGLLPVLDTPFDFNAPSRIGTKIISDHEQLNIGSGYDHNYILNNQGQLQKIATVHSSDNQLSMIVSTTEPGIQLYTGNHINIVGKKGKRYGNRSGFCLEPQHYPDSPNRPDFPSVILQPGEEYLSQTVYAFE